MHIVASMGDSISQQTAHAFINNFVDYDIISEKEALMLKAATSDKVLSSVPVNQRNEFKSKYFKNMLVCL